MKRRQFLALASSAAAAAILTACGKKEAASSAAATATAGSSAAAGNVTIKVGATPVPHADLLKVAAKNLEKEGVTLQIVEFNDYVQPNRSSIRLTSSPWPRSISNRSVFMPARARI